MIKCLPKITGKVDQDFSAIIYLGGGAGDEGSGSGPVEVIAETLDIAYRSSYFYNKKLPPLTLRGYSFNNVTLRGDTSIVAPWHRVKI